jgi:penicillin-binding protein 1C
MFLLLVIFLLIPVPGDKLKYSRSVYSTEGQLLSAKVSDDGQWCLPLEDTLPRQLVDCIIMFEDEYFYWHPGVNPVSMVKAFVQYLRNGRVIRGGSTLPMQVMRMRYKNARRNIFNKLIESLSAVRYSLTTRKKTILRDWAQMAPFGGNTIGAKSAALRYFGRDISRLSWGEHALLAVMPNSPSLVNLSTNREILHQKRNKLLQKLAENGYFPLADLEVYLQEELPESVKLLPDDAPYLLDFLSKKYPDTYLFHTTCPSKWQQEVNDILEKEINILRHEDIRNAAAVVIDVMENTLVAYTGNVRKNLNGSKNFVDIIQAPRSYGSLLKPFLYAYALEEGFILPNELIYDIPTVIGEFRPKNFDEKFRGAAPAEDIILQSLNVPSVRLLNQVGLAGFYHFLTELRPSYLDKGPDHYGLSLILGGGETTLWDLARLYKGMAQNFSGIPEPFGEIECLKNKSKEGFMPETSFSPGVISSVVNTMADVSRPREERFWYAFENDKKIAWKTGTSFGHRDAWAIGFNGKYAVAVWIGNENGEGRHDLTGVVRAAPVMFQIFNALPQNRWFAKEPSSNRKKVITVCRESGRLAGQLCNLTDKKTVDKESFRWIPCRFHTEVCLSPEGTWIQPHCKDKLCTKDTLFTLPAEVEYYYRESHLFYEGLPVPDPECIGTSSSLSIIYPTDKIKIFIPRNEEGKTGKILAKAYHSDPAAVLFWYLNDKHVYTSPAGSDPKVFSLQLSAGSYKLSVIDRSGQKSTSNFEVLE